MLFRCWSAGHLLLELPGTSENGQWDLRRVSILTSSKSPCSPPDHNPHEVFMTPQDHYVAVLALVYFYSNSVPCNTLIKFIVIVTVRIDRAMDRETGAILSDDIKQGCMTFLLKAEKVIHA